MGKYKFRTVAGKSLFLELDTETTIKDCKELFKKESGCDCETDAIKLIYKAQTLDDSRTIGSYGIKETDVVIAVTPKKQNTTPAPPQSPAKEVNSGALNAGKEGSPRPESPSSQPLPEIPSSNYQLPNMDELVASPSFQTSLEMLCELGFGKDESERALKAAMGDPDLAATYLDSGNIPSDEEVSALRQQMFHMNQLRQRLTEHPEELLGFIEELESSNRNQGVLFRAHPELLLERLGLSPDGFDLDAIKATAPPGVPSLEELGISSRAIRRHSSGGAGRAPPPQTNTFKTTPPKESPPPPNSPATESILSNYTQEEKDAVKRLQELGFDIRLVIQVFEACDKNENMAANCLLEMN